MRIDNQLISYLEELSCFSLSDNEKNILTADLQNILNGISKIKELNTDGVNERIHPFDNVNVFRDDLVFPSFDRELILKNAQVKNDEFFIAPKTVE
ncbi:MAG: Asp-tRNA(Asn)/Glu-tRNA(Gln) amidotransferase subunit GatC [Treponema sp.]|nr:Asp-tRNA(Asn)/Glu-tRNA(Gln) amidotransferase subunit GatC [Treponema sp.]